MPRIYEGFDYSKLNKTLVRYDSKSGIIVPNITPLNSIWNDPIPDPEFSSGSIVTDDTIITRATTNQKRYLSESIDLNHPEDKVFLVRDKNSGDILSGLSMAQCPLDPNTYNIKYFDRDPEGNNFKKAFATITQTPDGTIIKAHKLNIQKAELPPDLADDIDDGLDNNVLNISADDGNDLDVDDDFDDDVDDNDETDFNDGDNDEDDTDEYDEDDPDKITRIMKNLLIGENNIYDQISAKVLLESAFDDEDDDEDDEEFYIKKFGKGKSDEDEDDDESDEDDDESDEDEDESDEDEDESDEDESDEDESDEDEDESLRNIKKSLLKSDEDEDESDEDEDESDEDEDERMIKAIKKSLIGENALDGDNFGKYLKNDLDEEKFDKDIDDYVDKDDDLRDMKKSLLGSADENKDKFYADKIDNEQYTKALLKLSSGDDNFGKELKDDLDEEKFDKDLDDYVDKDDDLRDMKKSLLESADEDESYADELEDEDEDPEEEKLEDLPVEKLLKIAAEL
jgi:hypothetical protein